MGMLGAFALTERILRNAIICNKCHDLVESTDRHDFVMCSCGSVGVDGGKEYLRRVYDTENGYVEACIFWYEP